MNCGHLLGQSRSHQNNCLCSILLCIIKWLLHIIKIVEFPVAFRMHGDYENGFKVVIAYFSFTNLFQMVRNYKKKLGKYGKRNYDSVYLENAVRAVKAGMSIRRACATYAVPYTTLHSHVNDKTPLKYGRQPVLNDSAEKDLVEALTVCAEWGFPLKPVQVRRIVQQFLSKQGLNTRFRDNMPGHDWFVSFISRHNRISVKLAENSKRVRTAIPYEAIKNYFDNLEEVVKGVPPMNIINYDETNFKDDPGVIKVVAGKGSKHTHRTIDSSKTSTTVMFAISATGDCLPPYVVYKAKHMYEGWKEGGLDGSRYNRTLSGWFDSDVFEDWFFSIMLPYFKKLDGTKLLIGDNLGSHITVNVLQACEKNDIRFVLLPPNSTHMLQPLDVAYFAPLKRKWREVMEEWKVKNPGVLPKTLFPAKLKDAVLRLGQHSNTNAQAGFKACGIFPFAPERVLSKMKTTNGIENARNSWTNVIVNHLDQLKTGSATTVKRGKKMSVPAGKSIGVSDLPVKEPEKEKQVKKKTTKRMRSPSISSASEINDCDLDADLNELEEVEHLETDMRKSIDIGMYEIGASCTSTTEPDPTPETFDKDEFVIAQFKTNKRDRHFIGKIVEMDEEGFTVSTLRKKSDTKDCIFIFPQIIDIATISREQIIRKITVKQSRRGRYVFRLRNNEADMLE